MCVCLCVCVLVSVCACACVCVCTVRACVCVLYWPPVGTTLYIPYCTGLCGVLSLQSTSCLTCHSTLALSLAQRRPCDSHHHTTPSPVTHLLEVCHWPAVVAMVPVSLRRGHCDGLLHEEIQKLHPAAAL